MSGVSKPLRHRIAQNEPIGLFWMSLGSPAVLELAAQAKPDAVVIDAQHGRFFGPLALAAAEEFASAGLLEGFFLDPHIGLDDAAGGFQPIDAAVLAGISSARRCR